MGLEVTGIRLEAQNAERAIKLVEKMDKSIARLEKDIEKASKSQKSASDAATAATKKHEKALKNLQKEQEKVARQQADAQKTLKGMADTLVTKYVPGVGKASKSTGSLSTALGAITTIAGSSAAAVLGLAVAGVALGAIMIKLGARGAYLDQTADAFARVTGSVGPAERVLSQLREDVRGTVTDMELMRLATLGVQGASAAFRKEVLPNFGKIVDVTNRVAIATGQSADVIREKFILGLRRSSKLLLDDVGVMVDAEAANRKYAAAIGKSASALTDLEKQAAFARAAIEQLDAVGTEIGGVGGPVEQMQRFRASLQNIKDLLARAFTPIAGAFFTVMADSVGYLETAFRAIQPVIRGVADLISGALMMAWSIVNRHLKTFIDLTLPARKLLQGIGMVASIAADGFRELGNVIAEMSPLLNFLEPIAKAVVKTEKYLDNVVENLVEDAAKWGFFVIGSFATGIIRGARFVIKAVTFVAEKIADFLEAFSPPREGPLSEIDMWGENLAKTWAEGFLQGMIQPVENVVAYVNNQLGEIGGFTRVQVEARLTALDLAVRPFVEQLEIAKSIMEEMTGFLDPLERIFERQRKAALRDFGAGRGGDIESLRAFDRQLATIRDIREEQENQVDLAELQLAFANSLQARERALLLIQQRRLGKIEETTDRISKQPAGGAIEAISEGFGLGLEEETGDGMAERLRAAISRGAATGLLESGLPAEYAALLGDTGELQRQIGRIGGADPGSALVGALSGIPGKLLAPLDEIKNILFAPFNELFGGEGYGRIGQLVGENMAELFTSFMGPFRDPLNLASTFVFDEWDILDSFKNLFDFGEGGKIYDLMSTAFNDIFNITGPFQEALNNALDWVENTFGIDIETVFKNIFGIDGLIDKVFTVDFGEVTGKLLGKVVEFANGMINLIVGAWGQISKAWNRLISGVTGGAVRDAIASIPGLGNIVEAIDVIGLLDLPGLEAEDFQISIPGAQRGARGLSGMFMSGERGRELIMAQNPVDVFPHEATQALMRMASVPMGAPIQGGNTYNTTTNNTTYNATYNVPSQNSAIVMSRQLFAMSGGI